jgi:hypothetical protein
MNREDFLKPLYENKDFKKILSALKDDKERRIVKGITEEFVMTFAEVLAPLKKEIEKDPETFKNKLLEIEDTILNVSGSSTPT